MSPRRCRCGGICSRRWLRSARPHRRWRPMPARSARRWPSPTSGGRGAARRWPPRGSRTSVRSSWSMPARAAQWKRWPAERFAETIARGADGCAVLLHEGRRTARRWTRWSGAWTRSAPRPVGRASSRPSWRRWRPCSPMRAPISAGTPASASWPPPRARPPSSSIRRRPWPAGRRGGHGYARSRLRRRRGRGARGGHPRRPPPGADP